MLGERRLFVSSAVENIADATVKLPLYRGTSQGQTVWYVVLDASESAAAKKYGINRANKLRNAKGTSAVQKVKMVNGLIDFPATVDFSPERIVTPSATGFPPLAVQPGATGQPGYSPLIQLPNGTILNAPHLANGSGQADKVVDLNTSAREVVYKEIRRLCQWQRSLLHFHRRFWICRRRIGRRNFCTPVGQRPDFRGRWQQVCTRHLGGFCKWANRG